MALVTTRQKQSLLGYLLVVLLVIGALGLVWRFFVTLPFVAWPLLVLLVASGVWWYVRRRRGLAWNREDRP